MEKKSRELGIVKKIHPSGMVETDKKHKSNIKADIGDRLVQDMKTRIVTIAPKKSEGTAASKINKEDYNSLNQLELAAKYNIKELKSICKVEGITKYTTWNESELCEAIAVKLDTLLVDETE